MPKERRPNEERTSEDYRDAAEDSLELAKVLAREGGLSDQDLQGRLARSADGSDAMRQAI
mgnify:CR=1 FL=1